MLQIEIVGLNTRIPAESKQAHKLQDDIKYCLRYSPYQGSSVRIVSPLGSDATDTLAPGIVIRSPGYTEMVMVQDLIRPLGFHIELALDKDSRVMVDFAKARERLRPSV